MYNVTASSPYLPNILQLHIGSYSYSYSYNSSQSSGFGSYREIDHPTNLCFLSIPSVAVTVSGRVTSFCNRDKRKRGVASRKTESLEQWNWFVIIIIDLPYHPSSAAQYSIVQLQPCTNSISLQVCVRMPCHAMLTHSPTHIVTLFSSQSFFRTTATFFFFTFPPPQSKPTRQFLFSPAADISCTWGQAVTLTPGQDHLTNALRWEPTVW